MGEKGNVPEAAVPSGLSQPVGGRTQGVADRAARAGGRTSGASAVEPGPDPVSGSGRASGGAPVGEAGAAEPSAASSGSPRVDQAGGTGGGADVGAAGVLGLAGGLRGGDEADADDDGDESQDDEV